MVLVVGFNYWEVHKHEEYIYSNDTMSSPIGGAGRYHTHLAVEYRVDMTLRIVKLGENCWHSSFRDIVNRTYPETQTGLSRPACTPTKIGCAAQVTVCYHT